MNARLLVCAAVWLLCVSSAPRMGIAAETYHIDAGHTSIVFSVSHANMSYTYGFFRQSEGRFLLDRENPANCRFQLSINVDSIDTNNPERDAHLKRPDFFNSAQFPTITFDSTSVSQTSTNQGVVYSLVGNLTMHGVTEQVTIPLRMLGEGPGPSGDYRTGYMAQLTLNRSDFGMNNLPQFVGDAVGINISFEGIRQDSGGAAAPRR